jgi:nucleoside-diphosphate-sugar epimerase
VAGHVIPKPKTQPLSLVYVEDLAEATVLCLNHPAVAGRTYFVANAEVVSARRMADEVVRQIAGWGVPLPLPNGLLWPICLAADLRNRLTGRASVLSLQKFAELRAPGWVCDAGKLKADTGFECGTGLASGIARTWEWYRQAGWVKA